MSEGKVQWLVVTDLDGTMLNHHSYDFAAAGVAVHLLQGPVSPRLELGPEIRRNVEQGLLTPGALEDHIVGRRGEKGQHVRSYLPEIQQTAGWYRGRLSTD